MTHYIYGPTGMETLTVEADTDEEAWAKFGAMKESRRFSHIPLFARVLEPPATIADVRITISQEPGGYRVECGTQRADYPTADSAFLAAIGMAVERLHEEERRVYGAVRP